MSNVNLFDISAIERETGISKDVLRKWETRYGFPVPKRSDTGERLYPTEQLDKLRLIKRLMDSGIRPVNVVSLGFDELSKMAAKRPSPIAESEVNCLGRVIIEVLRQHDVDKLSKTLRGYLLRYGIEPFVLDNMSLLNEVVGDAWARGEIQVFEEHLYSEVIQNVLREAITTIAPEVGCGRVLLTTLPGEMHTLGIRMVETILSLHGAKCICIGAQTPLADIVQAATAFQVDIVAISFSIVYPSRRVVPNLTELRAQLPGNVDIWVGGSGVARLRQIPEGVRRMTSLKEAIAKLKVNLK